MTAHWQWVGCLLVVPYASFTSLITVSSGKTTGYVCVNSLDMYGNCRWAILDENDCPGVKKCFTAASTPQMFPTVAVSPLRALQKVAHSLQTCPLCHLLCLGNNAMELVIVYYIVSLTVATISESTFPGHWFKRIVRRLKQHLKPAWFPWISFAGGHVISFKTIRIHFAGFTCFNVRKKTMQCQSRLCHARAKGECIT